MTIADAFEKAPNCRHRTALVAAFAAVQSAIANCEAARVMTGAVASQLVDQVVAVAVNVANEVCVPAPEEPADAEQPAVSVSPEAPAETAGTENPVPDVSEADTVTEPVVPETAPADVDPPA